MRTLCFLLPLCFAFQPASLSAQVKHVYLFGREMARNDIVSARVTHASGRSAMINIGRKHGLLKSHQLMLVHDDARRGEFKLGTLTIIKVDEESAIGQMTGGVNPQRGDYVVIGAGKLDLWHGIKAEEAVLRNRIARRSGNNGYDTRQYSTDAKEYLHERRLALALDALYWSKEIDANELDSQKRVKRLRTVQRSQQAEEYGRVTEGVTTRGADNGFNTVKDGGVLAKQALLWWNRLSPEKKQEHTAKVRNLSDANSTAYVSYLNRVGIAIVAFQMTNDGTKIRPPKARGTKRILSGKVTNAADGTPAKYAKVTVFYSSLTSKPEDNKYDQLLLGGRTNASGEYKIELPSSAYGIRKVYVDGVELPSVKGVRLKNDPHELNLSIDIVN